MAICLSEPADVLILGVLDRVTGLTRGSGSGGGVGRTGLGGGLAARIGRCSGAALRSLLLLLTLLTLVVLVPGWSTIHIVSKLNLQIEVNRAQKKKKKKTNRSLVKASFWIGRKTLCGELECPYREVLPECLSKTY
jgi:hypothetical protein